MTFLGLMTLLGITLTSTTGDQLNFLLSVIFGAWPTFNSPSQPCNVNQFNLWCSVFGGDLIQATAFIGDGIFFIGTTAYSFLTRINAFGQIFFILFNPSIGGSVTGIPFVSFFLLGIQILILIYGITIIRGNPSGA